MLPHNRSKRRGRKGKKTQYPKDGETRQSCLSLAIRCFNIVSSGGDEFEEGYKGRSLLTGTNRDIFECR